MPLQAFHTFGTTERCSVRDSVLLGPGLPMTTGSGCRDWWPFLHRTALPQDFRDQLAHVSLCQWIVETNETARSCKVTALRTSSLETGYCTTACQDLQRASSWLLLREPCRIVPGSHFT